MIWQFLESVAAFQILFCRFSPIEKRIPQNCMTSTKKRFQKWASFSVIMVVIWLYWVRSFVVCKYSHVNKAVDKQDNYFEVMGLTPTASPDLIAQRYEELAKNPAAEKAFNCLK
jgi:hypothetical protein